MSKGPELLKQRMAKLGWNQTRLSTELGVDDSAISRWLAGKRRPDIDMAVRLQSMLGIPVAAWTSAS